MERLQQDSPISPKDHQTQVLGALAEAKKDMLPPAAATAPREDSMLLAKMAVSAFAGPMVVMAASAAMMAFNAVSASSKPSAPLVSTRPSHGKNTRSTVSIMPMNYAERKASADLVARSNIASMSLTGTTSTGTTAPAKGVQFTPPRKGPTIGFLNEELAAVKEALENPYGAGTKRLETDLARGVEAASQFVQKKPEAVKNTSPTFKAQVQSNKT